jgi:putative lipoic acid-binding regulatory protein
MIGYRQHSETHMHAPTDQWLQFPCPYPLKVLGKNTNHFHAAIKVIIERHIAEGEEVTYHARVSSAGRYMSVTVVFQAQSQQQLTEIYRDLNESGVVLMAL